MGGWVGGWVGWGVVGDLMIGLMPPCSMAFGRADACARRPRSRHIKCEKAAVVYASSICVCVRVRRVRGWGGWVGGGTILRPLSVTGSSAMPFLPTSSFGLCVTHPPTHPPHPAHPPSTATARRRASRGDREGRSTRLQNLNPPPHPNPTQPTRPPHPRSHQTPPTHGLLRARRPAQGPRRQRPHHRRAGRGAAARQRRRRRGRQTVGVR